MKTTICLILSTIIWFMFYTMGQVFNVYNNGLLSTMIYGYIAGGCSTAIGMAFFFALE